MFYRFNRFNSNRDVYIYCTLIFVLTLLVCFLSETWYITLLVLLSVLAAFYYMGREQSNGKLSFDSYMATIIRNIERTNYYAIHKLDLGIAVFSREGKLQWRNDVFAQIVGKSQLQDKRPEEIFADDKLTYDILSIKEDSRELKLQDRWYSLRHCPVKTREDYSSEHNTGLMVYLTDITDLKALQAKVDQEKLCLAFARFDNYEDVVRGLNDESIANLTGKVNSILSSWVAEHRGFICRMNKEQCVIGFTKVEVTELEKSKFPILDQIRSIRIGNKIEPTISIGIACEGSSMEELYKEGSAALQYALKRGGDQVVVNKGKENTFYGATNIVSAQSSRVRTRITAQTIREQIDRAENVLVMGHSNEDYDSIGAAIGMAKLSLSRGKVTYIVSSYKNDYFQRVADMVKRESLRLHEDEPDYAQLILNEEEALKNVREQTLLILVDHHRQVLTASQAVLEACPRRIIIDHHRQGNDVIEAGVLTYIEPSSSSASELITEMTGYFDDKLDFTPAEALCLYAGITLDTKNFAVQTGERTFEAAALLRRCGVKTELVRDLFKDNIESVQICSRLVADAKIPLPKLALTVYRHADKQEDAKIKVLIAKAADSLITITGISVSVVMVEYKDGSLGLSARSDGTFNVQVLMEKIGAGGGHQTAAAGQLANARAKDVEPMIIELAQEQFKEIDKNEGNSVTGC